VSKKRELIQECKRESEGCLYSSAALYIWLRRKRWWRGFFAVTPLVLGGFASWKLLETTDLDSVKVLTSACALAAGLLPTIYAAIRGDESLAEVVRAAGEMKNLQDRFRQCATVWSENPHDEFEGQFEALMERLEEVRARSLTAPERFFVAAQKKVKSGDYDFDVDLDNEETGRGHEADRTANRER